MNTGTQYTETISLLIQIPSFEVELQEMGGKYHKKPNETAGGIFIKSITAHTGICPGHWGLCLPLQAEGTERR